MNNNILKLKNAPLLNIRLELKFKEKNAIIDNLIFQFLESRVNDINHIETQKLQTSDIPENIRDNDEQLMYLPLKRLNNNKDGYYFFVGDRILAINFMSTYSGWADMQSYINALFDFLKKKTFNFNTIRSLNLHSINFISSSLYQQNKEAINWKIELNHSDISSNEVFLKTLKKEYSSIIGSYNLITQIVTNAKKNNDEQGIAIEVEVIKEPNNASDETKTNYSVIINQLHEINKKTFFSCITPSLLQQLEPKYE